MRCAFSVASLTFRARASMRACVLFYKIALLNTLTQSDNAPISVTHNDNVNSCSNAVTAALRNEFGLRSSHFRIRSNFLTFATALRNEVTHLPRSLIPLVKYMMLRHPPLKR